MKRLQATSILLFFVSIFFTSALHAQGFRMMSGRNHPEQKWQSHESEHFTLVLPSHLTHLAPEAVTVAEQTYAALSANTGVQFKNKIRIYLSDEDEIANGFAVPFGGGTTNIWVNVNETAAFFTGEVKWIRKVLAHELGHLFHFEITKSNIGLWGNLFGNAMPRFWSEGWAQYQTERWDSERGDRWLRTAIFDDNFSYTDSRVPDNGRLVYSVGNSQQRFFHSVYGDTLFNRISTWRNKDIPFIRYNDFYKAFKKSTGVSYASFEERWRKHMNIYYNSLAAGMQRVDSLKSPALQPFGKFVADARSKPGSDTLAVLGIKSMDEPARTLVLAWKKGTSWRTKRLAEGAIQEGFSFSPDGKLLAFARNEPGKNGSLVNILFVVSLNSGKETRISGTERASHPVWISNDELLHIQTENGTANLVRRRLDEKSGRPVTTFTGDVQITGLAVHPGTQKAAAGVFLADGKRQIALLSLNGGEPRFLGNGSTDDRNVIFSADGTSLYYESLRDQVPNVFVRDLESGIEKRLTYQFAGARFFDLTNTGDSLLTGITETRQQDYLYRIPATEFRGKEATVPDAYTAWQYKTPPNQIPYFTVPNASLIKETRSYSSFRNLDPLIQFALPDYNTTNGFSLFGFTTWSDPLAHHMITAIGSWMPQTDDPLPFYLLGYTNNQFRPTINIGLFKIPSIGQFYGGAYMLDELTGAEIQFSMPVDLFYKPYSSSSVNLRLRSAGFDPVRVEIYSDPDEILGFPAQNARQTDILLGYRWSKKRPVRSEIHPLEAYGLKLQLTGGTKQLGGETEFLRPEIHGFVTFPVVSRITFFAQARGVYQTGTSLAQDFVGFSRYDNLQFELPANANVVTLTTADRVRGHRQFLLGNKTAFASAEVRLPLLKTTGTKILGIFEIGEVTLSGFADAGYVDGLINIPGETSRKMTGYGYEFKNAFLIGPVQISHAVGVGYAGGDFTSEKADWHYRIRAALPF